MTTDFGYVLPKVIDPPETICIQIEIPNEIYHRGAFFGQMWELTRWYNWQRDDAHTAKEVAAIWLRIYNQIRESVCPELPKGEIVEDAMPLRVDCDCNITVDCCDGTTKTLATTDMINKSTQPGPQPQPPAGGCSEFDVVLQANNRYLSPIGVGAGDIVTITQLTGGWQDGGLDPWRCPTGDEYVFGSCLGPPASSISGDPCSACPHMALIASDGTNFYNAASGSFTIASTIPDGTRLVFQGNDSDISNNAGSVSFHVKICKSTTPAGVYYATYDVDYITEHTPTYLTWVHIPFGVPTTIQSVPPKDSLNPPNARCFVDFYLVTAFDSHGQPTASGQCWSVTAIQLTGKTQDPEGPESSSYTPCSSCHAGSQVGGTVFQTTGEISQLHYSSATQFFTQITIQPCS